MTLKRGIIITKIHLVISLIVVVPVAFIYGFNPSSQFNIYLGTVDEHNFFKAIMGLYLGFSLLWLIGILNKNYLRLALVSNFIFMFGLASGRLLSLLTDGIPSYAYIYGTIGELVLGFYGLWILKRK
ncbi:DUF4345 domain-containing protein [uncultured Winogradskyella sp.]|uniref:DUF4345 domain-containing protein n=1 Tax=uncultured Winogradskyella sp. TaxID=395353 RepID=UPI002632C702|nr:DUF4345 domain-containing protein [uncultured Winogradskyella sp.]